MLLAGRVQRSFKYLMATCPAPSKTSSNKPAVSVSVFASLCVYVLRAGRVQHSSKFSMATFPLPSQNLNKCWTRPALNRNKTANRFKNKHTNSFVCWPVVTSIRSGFRWRRARRHRKLERMLDATSPNKNKTKVARPGRPPINNELSKSAWSERSLNADL